MASETIALPAAGGGTYDGELFCPAAGPSPAIVVVPSVFGLNAGLRESAERFARRGYVVLVPDVFWRVHPGPLAHDEAGRAAGIARMERFDREAGLADLGLALAAMRSHPACNGKVAVMGYCFGGRYAYLALTRLGADAAVSFHGVGIEEHLDEATRVRAPLSFHFGDEDPWVPLDAVKRIKGALEGYATAMIYRYPGARHGFAQNGSAAFDAAACELAERRAFDTLDGLKAPVSA